MESLNSIRESINDIDRQIVTLLCEREKLVRRAGKLKTDEHSVRDPNRVEQVISQVRKQARRKNGTPELIEKIYRAIIASYINFELHAYQEKPDAPNIAATPGGGDLPASPTT